MALCPDSIMLNKSHSNSGAHMCLVPETRELYIEFRLQTHSPKYRGQTNELTTQAQMDIRLQSVDIFM